MTGGRIKRIRHHIGNEPFMLTYGDGVGDVDITALLAFHQAHGKRCTLTAVQPSARFGALDVADNKGVRSFLEKPKGDGAWINGGFFVCQPDVFSYIEGDDTTWERAPMETLAAEGEMMAFKHDGFWKPMDTLRDKVELETAWNTNKAEWKIW
jgi:glucose-1-phosphate cytidylyltransferase